MEFSDIFCSHCRDFNLNNLESILEDYVATGKVRYVDHFFGFGQTVQEGVVLAEMCAAEQGRYFEYKHALFQTVEAGAFDVDRAGLVSGMDMNAFRACREEQRYIQAMQEMVFVDNRGVNATPTFFVNDQLISGNRPDEIRQAIEAELAALE
jgi:protein-disulfide isomerase